jgi:uncharacterized protein YbcV (DUF1398 family)
MNTAVLHEVMKETQEGELTFPEVVRRLIEIEVESYFVDFASGRETLYLADGSSHAEPIALKLDPVAEEYSSTKLTAAIKGAQADTIRYPEFVKRSTAAGVVGYWAFLAGKKVIYFGRKGELHIEEFPRAQS